MEIFPTTEEEVEDLLTSYPKDGKRPILPKVSDLRQKLAEKAKQEPKFRFYALYDRIYRNDVLWSAWRMVQRNEGGPGIDGQTIDQVERYGALRLINEIEQELKSKTYTPQPIKRTYIPKGNGKKRPLGIPTVKDRIVQQAVLLILEPIFDTDFLDASYGFRAQRSAHHALAEIAKNLKEGRTEVYDADLKGYFDSIPHDQLMKAVEYRIADRSVLGLIRMWLTTPIIDKDDQGRMIKKRPTQGTPQGGVISPLLANLYLHWFDTMFHRKGGPFEFANARLIRYADDFVIMARYVGKRIITWTEETIEGWLKLEINKEKTKVLRPQVEHQSVDFLGYSFRYDKDLHGRRKKYWRQYPSKKAMVRIRKKVHHMTSCRCHAVPIGDVVKRLNRALQGWASYYKVGHPRQAFRDLNFYVLLRMRKFLTRQSQRPFKPPKDMSWYTLIYEKLEVKQL